MRCAPIIVARRSRARRQSRQSRDHPRSRTSHRRQVRAAISRRQDRRLRRRDDAHPRRDGPRRRRATSRSSRDAESGAALTKARAPRAPLSHQGSRAWIPASAPASAAYFDHRRRHGSRLLSILVRHLHRRLQRPRLHRADVRRSRRAHTSEEWAAAHGVPFNAQEVIDRAKREYGKFAEEQRQKLAARAARLAPLSGASSSARGTTVWSGWHDAAAAAPAQAGRLRRRACSPAFSRSCSASSPPRC